MTRPTLDSTLTGIVFASVAAGSSYTWFQLALHANWVAWLAWVPFVAIDVGGLIFGHNWINGRSVKVRVWGKITTLLAVTISVVGNGIEHAIAGGFLPVTMELTVAVGAIAPLVLFAMVHQWALKRQAAGKTARKAAAEPAAKSVGVKTPSPAIQPAPLATPPSEMESHRGQRAVIVAWVSSQDQVPKAKDIQTRWSCSRSTAMRVLAEVRSA